MHLRLNLCGDTVWSSRASVCLSIRGRLRKAEGGDIQGEVMHEPGSPWTDSSSLPTLKSLHHPPEPLHFAFLPFLPNSLSCRTSGTGPGAFRGTCAACGAWPDFSWPPHGVMQVMVSCSWWPGAIAAALEEETHEIMLSLCMSRGDKMTLPIGRQTPPFLGHH
jgi:hypothetical protein